MLIMRIRGKSRMIVMIDLDEEGEDIAVLCWFPGAEGACLDSCHNCNCSIG